MDPAWTGQRIPAVYPLQGLEIEGRNAEHRHGTEKMSPIKFICHCIKAWSGETGQTHIKSVHLTGNDATSTKDILDALEGHCKLRNNEIVAVTACKQLVQGVLGLLEYIKNCKEITVAFDFEAPYDKCFRNVILQWLRNQKVYEKCI